jgi:energy-coupling factor transport system substrate-specific component
VKRVLQQLEIPLLVLVPLVLLACAILQITQAALLTLVVVAIAICLFFANFEASKPALRQIMPAVVLGALAAAGRVLFMAFPDFKPVSAICIVAGVVFGRRAGFMVGALAALVSNFFFGQGPWTPWQMYAWGMIGYFAGVLADNGFFKRPAVIYVYGFLASLLYGVLLTSWHIIGFVQPLTWQSALLAYGAALPFDAIHAVATVTFLLLIYAPWQRKLERIKKKYFEV